MGAGRCMLDALCNTLDAASYREYQTPRASASRTSEKEFRISNCELRKYEEYQVANGPYPDTLISWYPALTLDAIRLSTVSE